MSNDAKKHIENDVLAWAVIGAIFGVATLALWGALLWQRMLG